ncbi:hypothetical protein KIW84_064251 [Lathyrus oleraceus]|uniref:Reverse transcriptase zinc-binding domain-containing protein n=1 Tax=Pisum sativum TaxID=3888 RepID=A0A9D5A8U1_PEA|nr:hypothetical protein KIW84_064251 [Pisum sativum]
MYKLLDEEQQIGHRNEWKKIWKIQALEGVWYFVWLLKYDRLLTNWNKRRLGIGSVMSGYCGNIVEDTMHVLRDFPLVMSFWLNVVEVHQENFMRPYDQMDFVNNILTEYRNTAADKNLTSGIHQEIKWISWKLKN